MVWQSLQSCPCHARFPATTEGVSSPWRVRPGIVPRVSTVRARKTAVEAAVAVQKKARAALLPIPFPLSRWGNYSTGPPGRAGGGAPHLRSSGFLQDEEELALLDRLVEGDADLGHLAVEGGQDGVLHLHPLEVGDLLAPADDVPRPDRPPPGVADAPDVPVDGGAHLALP